MWPKVRALVFFNWWSYATIKFKQKKKVIFVNCLFIVFCMLWSEVYQVINVVPLLVVDVMSISIVFPANLFSKYSSTNILLCELIVIMGVVVPHIVQM